MVAAGSSASAAMPRHSRIKWNTTIRLVPRNAERRAARGSVTVFMRISTWGSEAPPRARPSRSDSVSHEPENSRPGWNTAGPRAAAPACNMASGLKPNCAREAASTPTANAIIRVALTICSHVTASMPPSRVIASMPANTTSSDAAPLKPNSRCRMPPAPTNWAVR